MKKIYHTHQTTRRRKNQCLPAPQGARRTPPKKMFSKAGVCVCVRGFFAFG